MKPLKDKFNSFSELAKHKKEGEHYTIVVQEKAESRVSIIAPHGGTIEPNTSTIAKGIAANDHNLYIFEGLEDTDTAFGELHVTSHLFDDPRCLDLAAKTDVTVTIHGCRAEEEVIYIGGRDEKLKKTLAAAFNKHSIRAETEGHVYVGASPTNVCNMNTQGAGVQLEFGRGIRDNPELINKCVAIVREHLKTI